MNHPHCGLIPGVSSLPILAIAAVIEAQVLQPPFDKFKFTEPNISGSMQYFPDFALLRLDVLVEHVPYELVANIMFSSANSFTKPYFKCSSCGKPRDFLVFDRGLVCTEDYVESGSGRSKRQRRLNVSEARGLLTTVTRRKQSRWVPRDQWHEGVRFSDRYLPASHAADAAPKGAPARPATKPVKRESDYSTERGLALGRGAGQFDAFTDYLQHSENLIASLRECRPIMRRPLRPAALARTPVLDIKALTWEDRWPTADAPLSASTLQWPDDMNPLVIVDVRGPEPLIMVAHRWMEADRRWQLIQVRLQANGRRRFVCPVDGRTCDQLYLRDGAFASREAHHLFHDSQRGAGRSRAKRQPAK